MSLLPKFGKDFICQNHFPHLLIMFSTNSSTTFSIMIIQYEWHIIDKKKESFLRREKQGWFYESKNWFGIVCRNQAVSLLRVAIFSAATIEDLLATFTDMTVKIEPIFERLHFDWWPIRQRRSKTGSPCKRRSKTGSPCLSTQNQLTCSAKWMTIGWWK